MKRILSVLVPVFLIAQSLYGQANLYWRTDGTTGGTWSSAFWNLNTANATGGTGWTSGANAFFTDNSTLTFATNAVSDITVSANKTVTITAGGTLSLGTVRTFDIGSGALLDWRSQSVTANSAAGITKNGSGTLRLDALTFSTNMNGGFTLNNGTVSVSGDKALGNGSLTINGGTLQSSGTRAFVVSGITIGGDFTFSGTGNATFNTTVGLGSAIRTITNAQSSGSLIFSGTVSGGAGGGLTLSGTGSTTLIGTNTYSGGTTVSAGTLTAGNNTALGSGAVSVTGGSLTLNSGITLNNAINVGASGRINGNAVSSTLGGTISGTGTLGGSLTVSGTLSPGNSPGIMTIDGNLTLGSAAIYQWELANLSTSGAGTNFDQISLSSSGSLAINAGATLAPVFGASLAPNEGNSFWNTNRSWAVVQNNGSGTITGSFLINNSPWSNGTFSFNSSNSQVTLDWTAAAVPEPSTYAVLFGIATLVFVALRQRAHKVPPAAV